MWLLEKIGSLISPIFLSPPPLLSSMSGPRLLALTAHRQPPSPPSRMVAKIAAASVVTADSASFACRGGGLGRRYGRVRGGEEEEEEEEQERSAAEGA